MANYNEIVKILRTYSDANFVIKSFGNGEIWELVETFGNDDAEYPKLWAEDIPNTTEDGVEVFKFRIYMLGQVATLKEKTATTLGEDNTNEVKSNMRQNCLDLLSYLLRQTNYPEITVNKNITLTSFKDKSNDKLTGWFFDLNIRQAFRFSSCIIPMDGIPPPTAGTCDDGTVTIKDSDGNTLYVKTVASGGVATQSISDVTNTLNGVPIAGVLAEGNKAITLVDDLGAIINPTILTNTKTLLVQEIPSSSTPLNSSGLNKTGQTNILYNQDDGTKQFGNDVSFTVLDYNNKFGNTARFTDTLGNQIYADNIVIDHSAYNQINDTYLCYYLITEASANLITHMNAQPFTRATFSGWYVTNTAQIFNIANYGVRRNYFNYAPFNHSVTATADRLWTSTGDTATVGIYFGSVGLLVQTASSGIFSAMLCRIFTGTELGI